MLHIVIALTAVNLIFSAATFGARINDAQCVQFPLGALGSIVCSMLVIAAALFIPA